MFVYVFRAKAKAVADVIADITDVLAKASGTQKAVKDAIDATQDDIRMAEDILNQVGAHLFCSFKTSNLVLCFVLG